MRSKSTLKSGDVGSIFRYLGIQNFCYNDAARRRSSQALGSVASAASVEAVFQVDALRLRERLPGADALHYDSAAEPVKLTKRASGRPSAAAALHR
jgi:hypothetical protein